MDLTIKEVSDLLSVSEETILKWISKGTIPAYLLNEQNKEYRFNQKQIEDWVISFKSKAPKGEHIEDSEEAVEMKSKGGTKQFNLYRSIFKGGVYNDIPGSTKEEVIKNATQLIASKFQLDADVLIDLLLERENLMPTSLNNGIGIPHTRDFLLNVPHDIVTVVFPSQPIEYGALDEQPVHSLFFLFACEDRRHLNLLAKIAHFSSSSENVEFLKKKPHQQELLEYIKFWESSKKA